MLVMLGVAAYRYFLLIVVFEWLVVVVFLVDLVLVVDIVLARK